MKNDNSNQLLQVFIKIQQSQLLHQTALLNKQVGYFVHVETDKTYKLKNCIDSQKTNAELYKRFSKNFINNVRNGQDQMILNCGLEQSARIQTAIGCKKNPGMFLIAGISILDQKYQQDFTKYDVEISFMEYSDGNFYDLLSYTKQPLKMIKKDELISFGQTYCKVSTFSQFLKLFKIALFNNKQRQKTNDIQLSGIKNQQKVKSSLIMTIAAKKYSNCVKIGNNNIQKTVVIDFAGSRPMISQQQSGMQKGLWEYFLIQLNNLTCKKKLHYHLVQPNPLLCLTKNYLKYGKTFLICSLTANSQLFQQNYSYFTQLSQIAQSIPKQNQNNFYQSVLLNPNSTLKSKNQLICSIQKNSTQNEIVSNLLQDIQLVLKGIKNRKYNSLRQYRQLKQKNIKIIAKCMDWIYDYRKIFIKMMQNKRQIKLAQNQIISDQIKLIGSCIKSQHYKDFYQAKSYLSLERQIIIKTQCSRQQIVKLLKIKNQIKDKFYELKSKNNQYLQSISQQNNQMNDVRLLASKFAEFFCIIFFNLIFYEQRTLVDQILKQQNLNQNLNNLYRKLNNLSLEIVDVGKKGQILFENDNFKKDAHLTFLIKQVKNLMKKQQRNNKKSASKYYSNFSKQNNQALYNKKQNNTSGKFTKLPALSDKQINFQITGNFELSSLLFNPHEDV